MYRKILVPLDGSILAEAVLPQVRDIARCGDGEIVLLRVASYPLYDYTISDPNLILQLRAAVESEASSYLQAVGAALRAEDFKVSVQLAEGPVADTIVASAEKVGADLIAMSTHGRTGIPRLILGSVANLVVHQSRVPVLLVRPEKSQGDEPESKARETARS